MVLFARAILPLVNRRVDSHRTDPGKKQKQCEPAALFNRV
jgi:hypothetical protein